jgi:ion channel-forming bestrophin family protein
VVLILVAILYAVKNHLRAEWGAAVPPGTALGQRGVPTLQPEYSELLPRGLKSGEGDGLGLPLELTFFIEKYIQLGVDKDWFHAPQASQMQVQLNTITDAYGRMETIKLTPIPVAHL